MILNYNDYLIEAKSERKIVQDLARHLSFDKDVIKHLNTSRAKRKEGWRDLLSRKLHGSQLDYINYITKNMVADYNPQITGYIKYDEKGSYSDSTTEDGVYSNKLSLSEIVNDLADRISDIENLLGIIPSKTESLEMASKRLKEVGYEPDWVEEMKKQYPNKEAEVETVKQEEIKDNE